VDEFGYCNICNLYGKLTWDHVPPQGSTALRNVEMRSFVDRFTEVARHPVNVHNDDETLRRRLERRRTHQNGLKFLTICETCNNARLGGRYDPELNRVSREVARIVRLHHELGIALPDQIRVPVRTHFLMRGVVGHLLSALQSPDPSKPLPGFESGPYRELRDYVLDETLPLPSGVTVYYWTYPAKEHVVIKGLGLGSRDGERAVMGDLLKYFPLAFFVAFRAFGGASLPVPNIVGHECNDVDCTVDLYVNLRDIPPTDWPETPTADYYTIMPAEGAVIANAKDVGSRGRGKRKDRPRRR
jgi:hypothetical protein